MPPIVSVIICTHNRSDLLRECILSFVHQEVDTQLYEIIVVDNGSTDNTRSVVETMQEQYPNIAYYYEPILGLSQARNSGMNQSNASHVVYIDDDAKAHPNYIQRCLWLSLKPDCVCVGGRYLPWYKYGKPHWFRDEWGSNKKYSDELAELSNGFISGGNSFFKKDVLAQVGGFSTEMSIAGTRLAYGEDTEVQVKISKAGYKIFFDPELLIDHLVGKYKLRPNWFLKSNYAKGRDLWKSIHQTPTPVLLFKIALKSLKDFGLNLFKCSFKLLIQKNYFVQNWYIDLLSPLSFALGRLQGALEVKKD